MNKQALHLRHSSRAAGLPRPLPRPLPLCLAIAALCCTGLAAAADLTWKGGTVSGGLSGRMSVGQNWNPNAQPATGDILHFGVSSFTTVVNDLSDRTYKQISFETGASAFTLQGVGNNIALTDGIVNRSSNVQTFDWGSTAGFVISAAQTWDGGTAGMNVTGGMDQQNNLVLSNKVSYTNLNANAIGSGTTDNAALTIQSGSSYFSANYTSLGRGVGRSGTVIVQGLGSSFASGAQLYVGDGGDGWLQVKAGASAKSAELIMGRPSGGGYGVVELTGTGSNLQSTSAWGGAGILNVSNGASVQITGGMTLGDQAGSSFAAGVGGGGARLSVAGTLLLSGKGYGRLDVQADGLVEAGHLVVANGSVVNLQGGTLKLRTGGVAGTFNWESGTLNFSGDYATGDFLGHDMVLSAGQTLKGDASVRVGAGDNLALAGGQLQANTFRVDSNGRVTVGRASSLSATALENYGRLTLDSGSVNGALSNAGYMTGSASFQAYLGRGGFSNSGRFEQGDFVELANASSNTNSGVWTLGPGATLQLKSSNLNNHGLLSLAGATIGVPGGDQSMLVNEAGGTISRNGFIRSNFSNLGSVIVEGGKLAIDKSFSNGGQILLNSANASLSGGAITNTGRIEGLGQIGNDIANQGFVSAKGGTLTLAAGVSNSGTLTVGRDATLRLTQGLQPNTGKIQLAGGTFDNNGRALVNQAGGVISGFGEVRSGPLSNNGLVLLSGGVSAVYSQVVANAGSQIILSGNSNTTFYDKVEVQGGAELRVSEGSVATLAAEVKQRNGSDVNGDGKMFFEGGLSIGNSPGYGYIQGSVTFASSNSYFAEIGGIHACSELSCAEGSPLLDSSFDKLVIGGNLKLGGTLVLSSWNGFVAQAGQSFDLLDWGSTSGTFKSIDASGLTLAAGTQLDYSELYSSGTISVTAVPEPASYALLLAGMGLLAWRRRKLD